MPETPQRLAERLHSEGQKTAQFFRDLTGDQLDQQLYADGSRWKVRQLLAHFVTAEAGFVALLEDVLAGGTGAAQDFDIDAYNEKHVAELRQASVGELLAMFDRQRQATIALVNAMQPADLQKTGRHPYLGEASVESILKLCYRHNQIHQRDVRKHLAGEDKD